MLVPFQDSVADTGPELRVFEPEATLALAGAAISRIYANIGFRGLWNGLPVRIGMIGTLTAFQWLIYDSFKVYLGLPTTGGH